MPLLQGRGALSASEAEAASRALPLRSILRSCTVACAVHPADSEHPLSGRRIGPRIFWPHAGRAVSLCWCAGQESPFLCLAHIKRKPRRSSRIVLNLRSSLELALSLRLRPLLALSDLPNRREV